MTAFTNFHITEQETGRKGRPYRRLARLRARVVAVATEDRGSQITDNLGLIVIGVVAIVAIGGLISGLDSTVFNWVTGQLGVSGS
jgi:hypothetical protein